MKNFPGYCKELSTRVEKPDVTIRNEKSSDTSAIGEVTIAAFNTLEISNHTEQFIIEALRADP